MFGNTSCDCKDCREGREWKDNLITVIEKKKKLTKQLEDINSEEEELINKIIKGKDKKVKEELFESNSHKCNKECSRYKYCLKKLCYICKGPLNGRNAFQGCPDCENAYKKEGQKGCDKRRDLFAKNKKNDEDLFID